MTWTTRHLWLVLMALGGVVGCAASEPCDEPYSCPDYDLNCMPPVAEDSPCADSECLTWIRQNCPDVGVSF